MAAIIIILGGVHAALAKQIILGPPDPGAELGGQWYNGTNGAADLFLDATDPNRGGYDFTLGNTTVGKENRADWRSQLFSLGPAARGAEPITFSFACKLPGQVKPGDDIAIFLRFFDDSGTNFLDQVPVMIGSSSGDSEMSGYKIVTLSGLRAHKNIRGARATAADIWVTCNIFKPWSSGDARFDDFSVTTIKPSRLPAILISATILLVVVAAALLVYSGRRRTS